MLRWLTYISNNLSVNKCSLFYYKICKWTLSELYEDPIMKIHISILFFYFGLFKLIFLRKASISFIDLNLNLFNLSKYGNIKELPITLVSDISSLIGWIVPKIYKNLIIFKVVLASYFLLNLDWLRKRFLLLMSYMQLVFAIDGTLRNIDLFGK